MRLLICVEILACRGSSIRVSRAGQNHDLTQVDRRSATTCAVAPPADSRVHAFGSSLRASWCRLTQTNAECRVLTVRLPSPGRPVVQSALSPRTGASQMMGGATLQPCLDNFSWQ